MKKCKFYRTVKSPKSIKNQNGYKVIETDGYYDIFTDSKGNKVEICCHSEKFPKSTTIWTVTEKNTGLRVCEGNTRKQAIEEFKNKYIDFVYEASQQERYEKYKKEIEIAYKDLEELSV